MRRKSMVRIVAGFIVGALLLSQLSYLDKVIIGANPLQVKGYFVAVLFGGSTGAIITYLLRIEIAERKRAEEALRASEMRLNTILSSMNDLVCVFDSEGRFTGCYSTAEGPYVPPQEFLGKRHDEMMFPYAGKLFSWAFEKTETGEVVEYESWLERDGENEWYSIVLSPMFLEDEFVGAVSVMRNITKRKRAEEALEESEDEYQTLVDELPYGLVIVQDTPPCFVLVNSTAAKISGYSAEELLFLPPEEIKSLVHPDDRDLAFQCYQDLLAGKPAPPNCEFRVLSANGAVRWLRISASHIEYHGMPAVRTLFTDVSGRKWVEQTLQKVDD